MRYLADTNVLSEPFRGRPNPALLARLRQHEAEIVTAAIVWEELWYGHDDLAPCRKKAALGRYFEGLRSKLVILPYDERAARWHAAQRVRLKHRTPPYRDGLIAAVAATNDLVVVTDNVKDFAIYAIPVENWRG